MSTFIIQITCSCILLQNLVLAQDNDDYSEYTGSNFQFEHLIAILLALNLLLLGYIAFIKIALPGNMVQVGAVEESTMYSDMTNESTYQQQINSVPEVTNSLKNVSFAPGPNLPRYNSHTIPTRVNSSSNKMIVAGASGGGSQARVNHSNHIGLQEGKSGTLKSTADNGKKKPIKKGQPGSLGGQPEASISVHTIHSSHDNRSRGGENKKGGVISGMKSNIGGTLSSLRSKISGSKSAKQNTSAASGRSNSLASDGTVRPAPIAPGGQNKVTERQGEELMASADAGESSVTETPATDQDFITDWFQ